MHLNAVLQSRLQFALCLDTWLYWYIYLNGPFFCTLKRLPNKTLQKSNFKKRLLDHCSLDINIMILSLRMKYPPWYNALEILSGFQGKLQRNTFFTSCIFLGVPHASSYSVIYLLTIVLVQYGIIWLDVLPKTTASKTKQLIAFLSAFVRVFSCTWHLLMLDWLCDLPTDTVSIFRIAQGILIGTPKTFLQSQYWPQCNHCIVLLDLSFMPKL